MVRVKPGCRLYEDGATRVSGDTFWILESRFPSLADLVDKVAGAEPVEAETKALSPSDKIDKRNVFVIHGRNRKIKDGMFNFLRSLDLNPLEWSELVAQTGEGSPHISRVIHQGIRNVGAVIALLTPDDVAFLDPTFWKDKDKDWEKQPSPQARANVLFEMGIAFALHENHTIIVQVGELRPFTDISGMHVVFFDGSSEARNELKTRLRTVGCPVKDSGQDWLNAGDFSLQPTTEFRLNVGNSTIAGSAVSLASGTVALDLESKRQLVYARAVEILTRLFGQFYKNSQGLPGYLWSNQYRGWMSVAQQLVRINGMNGRAEAITDPSVFRSIDRGKMKAAAKIVEMYLWAADHNHDFIEIRRLYDLPDSNQVREEFHEAQLSSVLT